MHRIFSVEVWKPKAEQECILIGEDSWPKSAQFCPALQYLIHQQLNIILSYLSILFYTFYNSIIQCQNK